MTEQQAGCKIYRGEGKGCSLRSMKANYAKNN